MLKRAHEFRPEEPVYRYSYKQFLLGIERKIVLLHEKAQYLENEFHQLKAVREERFQGEGLLSTYFRDVFHSFPWPYSLLGFHFCVAISKRIFRGIHLKVL